MQDFVITLLICTAVMSAVALSYMALTPLLHKRYSDRGRYYAWLVIVLGFVIPFRPQWGGAIVTVNVPVSAAVPAAPVIGAAPAALPEASVFAPASVSWWQIAVVVWVAGMALTAAYHLMRHVRFMKNVNRWSESVNGERLALFHELKAEMGIDRRIGLSVCSSIGSPMLAGFVKPCILLPGKDFTRDELHFILRHELVHYKRKDLYFKCLVLAATCMHWFNPAVYLMAKAINAACEQSCDAAVIRSTGMDTRQHYSETIIGLARYQSRQKTALSTNFFGGMKGMKKRIVSIMDTGKKRIGIIVVCAAVIATLGTGFVVTTHAAAIENAAGAAATDAAYATENAIDDVYLRNVADSLRASIEPYAHLGLSVDETIGTVMYEGHPVREIFDPLTGGLITESMGANAFNGRNIPGAVDLTVQYESNAQTPTGFRVSTQEEFDARTEERRNGVSYAFEGADSNITEQEQAESERQRREETAQSYAE